MIPSNQQEEGGSWKREN